MAAPLRLRAAHGIDSLHLRLLAGFLLAIGAVGVLGVVFFGMQVSREQRGLTDRWMEAVGQQMLQSLPSGLENGSAQHRYRLPAQIAPREAHMNYHIWLQGGRLALRSLDAPTEAMAPLDFTPGDGFGRHVVAGEERWVYSVVAADGAALVQVAKSERQMQQQLWRWLIGGGAAGLMLLALLGGVAWAVVRRSLGPVDTISRTLAARSALDLRPVDGSRLPCELRPLVEAFNQLLGRLDHALQGERRFVADAAHELRTPLAALMAQARLAQRAESLEGTREALRPLIEGIERSARLTEQLLDLARVDALAPVGSLLGQRVPDGVEGSPAPLAARSDAALHELVPLLVQDHEPAARQRRQRLRLHAEPCRAAVSLDMLGVLVNNLLDNASRHAGEGACIEVVCRPQANAGRPGGLLIVRDDGPGVPMIERQRIFGRFYRIPGTTGRGSGIGLSLVARIAELHDAVVEVGEGLSGRGFGITLWFPAVPTESDAASAADEAMSIDAARAGAARPAAAQRAHTPAARRLPERVGDQ